MRSFRLDSDSVSEFRETWPGLVIGLMVLGLLAYFGLARHAILAAAILFGGLYVTSLLDGSIGRRLRRTYPGARSTWLLTAGMVVFLVGFVVRILGREVWDQPGVGPIDLVWLGGAFALILAFVILNRKNASVMS